MDDIDPAKKNERRVAHAVKTFAKSTAITVLIQSLFLLALPFASRVSAEGCQVFVDKDNGRRYGLSNISDFVKNEIRPIIQQPEKLVVINITKSCDNVNEKTTLGMDSKDYYIVAINGKDISKAPTNIVDYNNRLGLDLNKETFIMLVNATSQYDFSAPIPKSELRSYRQLEELTNKQRILKMYAFVFAETARFEDAFNSLDKIFRFGCSIDWHDFDALVHNWSNMSRFVIANRLLESSQYKSGSLVAPITTAQTKKFISGLQEGRNIEYSRSTPFAHYDYEQCAPGGG